MELSFSLSDLGDNLNLYKSLTDSSEVTEWADGQVSTCTRNSYQFSFDLSKSDTCSDGNCRVNFILIYPANVGVTRITWTNTAETSDEILQADLNTTATDDNLKIFIPEDLLMMNVGISFSQDTATICEIIVAGISADEYKCSAGKFLNSGPIQCVLCPVGQYGDEKGLKECKICPDNFKSETEGSTECTPCDYLKFSSSGSSSCQDCNEGTTLKPSCFLNPRPRAQTTNLVSSSFGPSQLRSLEHEDYAGYNVGDGDSIPLNSEDKPFYVDSIVLITNISAPQGAVPTINSCTRNTSLNFPNGTLVFTCDEVGLESLTVASNNSVKLYKLFVFGIPFIEASAPPGHLNNGSQFLKCSPGTYSTGGVISECKPCLANYISENTGSTECRPCDYLKFGSPGSSSCQNCDDTSLLKPSCFLNPRPRTQTTNLVSSSFGPPELRSLEHEDFDGYLVGDGDSIPLVSENKPFLVVSVVLVINITMMEDVIPIINSCTRNTDLNFPNGTLVFTCDEVGLESLTVANINSVKLYKLFVFGIPFKEAPAPPGHLNNGSQFLKCSPGSYSTGGMVTKCTSCQANQAQPKAGQTSCINCNEGYYSAVGATSCTICEADTPQCLTACRSKDEKDPKYGHYSWPTTKPGGLATSTCVYNSDGEAYKHCNKNSKQFEPTDFRECRSKVHEEVERILDEARVIHNETEQQSVSNKIQDLTQTSSDAMNSEDVKHTAEIIEKLIEFDEGAANKTLDQNVRENILKTVEKVHRSTDKQEIAKSDTASSMRSSVDKFANKVSDDSSANDTDEGLIYLKEETMGIVISKKTGAETSFTVSGDISNYTQSNLTDGDKDVLFSVNVPADNKQRPVTAVLYNSAAFYPENETVTDLTNVLAQIFTSSNNSNRVPSKVVSMVTEIRYAGNESTENIHFKSGETVRLKYRVQEENPRVHFKMPLDRRFECVFYNTTTQVWVTGDDSGCITAVEKESEGGTFVSCECSHMTSFAVLMSLETDYDPIEATVTTILLGISLGCLFLTIIAYLPSKKFLKRESVRINLFMVTSLIFSIVVFYFMELVVLTNFKEQKVPYESDRASLPCLIIACLMNYFWLCQMAWMVCEAVVLYKAVVVIMDPHVHRYMLKFNLFGWGAPVIFPAVGVGWGRADFANPKTCFIREKYGIATFYAPVVLCILFNTVIFILIIRARLNERSTNQGNTTGGPANQKDAQKKELKIVVSVMTWLGIAWVFGFFLMFQDTNAFWLRWLFIVFNSTQGIFIFILYVLLNEDIKKVWKEVLHLSPSEKPSHSSNLRSKINTGRSKGQGTKTTSGGNTCTLTKSVTEMEVEPLYSTLPGQPASEMDCTSPLLITSSLVVDNEVASSAPPRVFKTKPGPGGVHIYDNFASTLSSSMNRKITDSYL